MENSMTCMSKGNSLSSGARTVDAPEESSWTFYIDDFECNNDNEQVSPTSSRENPSLVSDAASSAAKKLKDTAMGFSLDRNSSFKKRKANGAVVDAALEDTASSPVSSPKVGYFAQFAKNRKENEVMSISEVKVGGGEQTDERSEFGIVGMDSEYTELKKRGLCLVPVSTFANYH